MPPSAYPFALLFLECDAEEVDVNVHPSKTEVRFRHGSFVHDFVRDTIRERLMESRPAPSFSPAARPPAAHVRRRTAGRAPAVFRIQPDDRERGARAPAVEPGRRLRRRPPPPEPRCPSSPCAPPPAPAPRLDFSAPPLEVTPGPPPSGKLSRHLDAHGEFPPEAIPPPEMSLSVLSDLRPLGQIHESFIIAAGRDGLWIIDQHVAHERILFEQVMKQRAAGRVEMQRLLMPLILQLTPEQQIDYARIADELHASGFETEPFGNRTIAVKAAPGGGGRGRPGEDPVRDPGDRRGRAARRLARRPAPQHLRLHRLPRRHQDQHPPGCQPRWNGCCARWPRPIAP